MTKKITSARWRGEFAEPIDASTVLFTAEPANLGTCKGCYFEDQRVRVCDQVERLAASRELPICSTASGPNYVYVVDPKTDPRQIRFLRDGSAVQEGGQL